jgi:hypothetical protein
MQDRKHTGFELDASQRGIFVAPRHFAAQLRHGGRSLLGKCQPGLGNPST